MQHLPQNLTQQQLHRLAESIDTFLFKQHIGENYHKDYKANPELFKKFVTLELKMKKNLVKFFSGQFDRMWNLVFFQLVKADETDSYLNNVAWDAETNTLTAILEVHIGDLFDIGSRFTQEEIHITTNIDQYNARQAKFITKYSMHLAKSMNDTTKNRVREQLRTSLALGETRQQLAERIDAVVNNPVRAKMIAQTESIRAFTQARLETARRVGGYKKQWFTNNAQDVLCREPEIEGAIDIDQNFSGGFDGPPAHPNCRCYVRLVYDPSIASAINNLSEMDI